MNKYLLTFTMIITCLALAACSAHNTEQRPGFTRPYTVWWSNPREYNSNVLSVAQAETPFTIILPSYLPAGIYQTPHFAGPAQEEFDDNDSVRITYKRQRNGDDLIIIEETSKNITTYPGENYIYLMYLNTEVLEEKRTLLSFTGDGKSINVTGYLYAWNRNGLHFAVTVAEYERDEARKIVESMIK
jgi:hypothetical protein